MMRLTRATSSQAGRKAENQDYCDGHLNRHGAVFALADGIGSSSVSRSAAEHAVNEFVAEISRAGEAMTARSAGLQMLDAINARLLQESRVAGFGTDLDRGYVCAFSALVLKGRQAHLFHVGDTRLYRWRAGRLECLTQDHRVWLDGGRSCLARALGAAERVEADYRPLDLAVGDVFILSSDGLHDYLDQADWTEALATSQTDYPALADRLVRLALARGSDDNLSIQLVRLDALPESLADPTDSALARLPFAPEVSEGDRLDGLLLVRAIHRSPRSQVFKAVDDASGQSLMLKLPSREGREDAAYLRRFVREEWIARRIDSPQVVKAPDLGRPRSYCYSLMEWIDGQTLDQWRRDRSGPELEAVRDILEQVGRGLQAMHRRDLLHQDIKPDNLMIDRHGRVRIIDFGSTRSIGLEEAQGDDAQPELLGTALYTAPEYFLGEFGDSRSDLFSLAVLGYYLLSGEHPYGTRVARARSPAAQRRLRYRPLRDQYSELPAWLDATLQKAAAIRPEQRYGELSEFLHDLRHPNPKLVGPDRRTLLERDPVRFWQGVSLGLTLLLIWQWL